MSKYDIVLDAYHKNTSVSDIGDGRVRIKCKKGLWSVEGPMKEAVNEAIHYFKQYWNDGEYECA